MGRGSGEMRYASQAVAHVADTLMTTPTTWINIAQGRPVPSSNSLRYGKSLDRATPSPAG